MEGTSGWANVSPSLQAPQPLSYPTTKETAASLCRGYPALRRATTSIRLNATEYMLASTAGAKWHFQPVAQQKESELRTAVQL